ncbi:TIGR03089 family protein, partial [Streptomyces albidoflavus]
ARAEAARLGLGPGDRVLSGLGWETWEGLAAGLYAPLAAGGSVVLCRNTGGLSEEGLARRVADERVDLTLL